MSTNAKEHRTTLLQLLAVEAELFALSDGWQTWLRFAAKFRTYSLSNQLLILAQCPTATRVAGYRTWAALGRQVRAGERGIGIVAPSTRRTHADDDEIEGRSHITGFRVVHVFDISQTDGDPIPLPEWPAVRVPDVELRQQLIHAAEAAGYTVTVVPRPKNDVRGSYNHRTKTITLMDGYEASSQIRTLLHELAHACDPQIANPDSSREEGELIAETAAYLVGTDMGLDMAEASAHYVTSWGAGIKRLLALAEDALAVAKAVDAITAQLPLPEVQAR